MNINVWSFVLTSLRLRQLIINYKGSDMILITLSEICVLTSLPSSQQIEGES